MAVTSIERRVNCKSSLSIPPEGPSRVIHTLTKPSLSETFRVLGKETTATE